MTVSFMGYSFESFSQLQIAILKTFFASFFLFSIISFCSIQGYSYYSYVNSSITQAFFFQKNPNFYLKLISSILIIIFIFLIFTKRVNFNTSKFKNIFSKFKNIFRIKQKRSNIKVPDLLSKFLIGFCKLFSENSLLKSVFDIIIAGLLPIVIFILLFKYFDVYNRVKDLILFLMFNSSKTQNLSAQVFVHTQYQGIRFISDQIRKFISLAATLMSGSSRDRVQEISQLVDVQTARVNDLKTQLKSFLESGEAPSVVRSKDEKIQFRSDLFVLQRRLAAAEAELERRQGRQISYQNQFQRRTFLFLYAYNLITKLANSALGSLELKRKNLKILNKRLDQMYENKDLSEMIRFCSLAGSIVIGVPTGLPTLLDLCDLEEYFKTGVLTLEDCSESETFPLAMINTVKGSNSLQILMDEVDGASSSGSTAASSSGSTEGPIATLIQVQQQHHHQVQQQDQ